MKTYSIPVTHTATTVVEHRIVAKNMQDAMFQLGQSIITGPDPFDRANFEHLPEDLQTEVKAGTPTIVADDEALDFNTGGVIAKGGEVKLEPGDEVKP